MGAFEAALLAAGLVVALLCGAHRGPGQAARLRLLSLFGGVSLLLASAASALLWERLPGLANVQLPWRLLEPLALAGSAAAGSALAACSRQRAPGPRLALSWGSAAALSVALYLCGGLAWSLSGMNGTLPRWTVAALAELHYRRSGYFLPRGAMDPRHLREHPAVEVQTPGVSVELLEWSSARRRLRFRAEARAQVALRSFHFPGWRARLAAGGAALPLRGEPPTGRMLLELPAGEGEAVIEFVANGPRRAGVALSAAAAAGLLAAAWIRRRRDAAGSAPSSPRSIGAPAPAAIEEEPEPLQV
jgi:hypothetical protein